MVCKYCKTQMMHQGADRIQNEYWHMYNCTNHNCKAVYEEKYTLNGTFISSRWWNPETEEFE